MKRLKKTPTFLKDVDIEKVLVYSKVSFGEKAMNILLVDFTIIIKFKSYDAQTKWMYFLIEDDEFLEKCDTIWDKVSADI